jgi:hypothetical protein
MALTIKIQEYTEVKVAELGTDNTTIKITAHGLLTGDLIVNTNRKFFGLNSSSFITKVNDDTLTTISIDGQTSGDSIRLYKFVDRTSILKSRSLNIYRDSKRNNNARFTLVTDTNYIPQAGQNVEIYNNSTLIFGGSIQVASRKRIGNANDYVLYIDIICEGYNHIPARRTVEDEFLNKTAKEIVEFQVDNYLLQEGITKGTIETGATLEEYPFEFNIGQDIKKILDDMAEISGYSWYIDNNRQLNFVLAETVSDSAYTLEDDGVFQDFWDVEIEESLSDYRNKQFVKGGVDDDGDQILIGSQNFTNALNKQNIAGGSGVYGDIFENPNITEYKLLEAFAGTDETTITTETAHELQTGDIIVNRTRNNAKRQIIVIDANTFTVDSVTDQAVGDEIKTYPAVNTIMRRLLQTYAGGKTISFRTTTLDFETVTKLHIDIASVGAVNEDYFIESVTLFDTDGKNLQAEVMGTLRDFTNLSTMPVGDWTDYFRKLVDLGDNINASSIARFG